MPFKNGGQGLPFNPLVGQEFDEKPTDLDRINNDIVYIQSTIEEFVDNSFDKFNDELGKHYFLPEYVQQLNQSLRNIILAKIQDESKQVQYRLKQYIRDQYKPIEPTNAAAEKVEYMETEEKEVNYATNESDMEVIVQNPPEKRKSKKRKYKKRESTSSILSISSKKKKEFTLICLTKDLKIPKKSRDDLKESGLIKEGVFNSDEDGEIRKSVEELFPFLKQNKDWRFYQCVSKKQELKICDVEIDKMRFSHLKRKSIINLSSVSGHRNKLYIGMKGGPIPQELLINYNYRL